MQTIDKGLHMFFYVHIFFFLSILCILFQQTVQSNELRNNVKPISRVSGFSGNNSDLLWIKELATHANPGGDEAVDAVVDRHGNSYITGNNAGLGTGKDFLTIKVDTGGRVVWTSRHDGPLHWRDESSSIAIDANGNTYVAGLQNGDDNTLEITLIKIDTAGTKEWVRSYKHHGSFFYRTKITVDLNAIITVAGCDFLFDRGLFQVTVVQYFPEGSEHWHRIIDSCAHLSKIITDKDKNLYLIGEYGYGVSNSVVIKLDSMGVLLWKKPVSPMLYDALIDGEGNLIVTGGTTRDFDSQFYIGKLDSSGTVIWKDTLETPIATSGRSIAFDNTGSICVSALTVHGTTNIITLKYDSLGHRDWLYTFTGFSTNIATLTNLTVNRQNEVFVGTGDRYNSVLLRFSSSGTFLGKTLVPGCAFIGCGFDGRGYLQAAGGYYDSAKQNDDYSLVTFDSNGNHLRTVRYEDHTNSRDEAAGMVLDGSGNIYVAGHSVLSTLVSLTLWKLDPNGNLLSTTLIVDSTSPDCWAVAVGRDSSGNIVILGKRRKEYTGDDYSIAKVDSEGTILWTRHYAYHTGTYDETPTSLAIDDIGNIYVTGRGATSSWLPHNYDFLTVKFNPTGEVLWARRYNGPANNDDIPSRIRIGRDGRVYVAGVSLGTDGQYDFAVVCYGAEGDEKWSSHYEALNSMEESLSDMVLDDSSSVICAGGGARGQGTVMFPTDFLIMKINSDGNLDWSRRYDISSIDQFLNVGLDHSGNIVAIGKVWYDGSFSDFATFKYDPSGTLLWSNTQFEFPTNSGDFATHVNFDGNNGVYVLGYAYVASDSRDLELVAYSPEGTIQWVASYNGLYYGDDIPGGIAVDHENNLYVLETSRSINNESSVIHLLKINPQGPSEVGTSRGESYFPVGFAARCWPNPFNPTTTISYQLPIQSHVTLKVFDILGREVETLVNGIEEPGYKTVNFNASRLSSGMYYYRLQAGNYVETKKLLLLR